MADYGLQITGMKYGTEKVLFDSRSVGRGMVQHSKGTIAFGSTLTTLVSDLVAINITKPSGSITMLVTAQKTVSGQYIDWVFSSSTGQGGGGTGYSGVTGVNYVVLRDVGSSTGFGNYGLVCNDGVYSGGSGAVSFDSRQFTSTEGEVQLIPSKMYSEGQAGHGLNIGYGWLGTSESGGDDYYSCHGMDYSSVTSYIRTFGIWFTTQTTGVIWSTTISSGYPNFNNSTVGYINATGSGGSGGGVYLHNFTFTSAAGSSSATFPQALTPPFVGRITLGTYDPE